MLNKLISSAIAVGLAASFCVAQESSSSGKLPKSSSAMVSSSSIASSGSYSSGGMSSFNDNSSSSIQSSASGPKGIVTINDFEESADAAFAYDHNGWDGSGSLGNDKNEEGYYIIRMAEAAAGGSEYGIGAFMNDGDIVGFTLGLDVSDVDGCPIISYEYKGASHSFQLVSDADDQSTGIFHQISQMGSGVWSKATIRVEETRRAGQFHLDEESIIQFRWDVRANKSFDYLYIDNVKCVDPREYDISFYVGGELKESKKVLEGDLPEYTGEPLARESNELYDYFFAGWDPELVPAAGDASYTAVFDSTLIYRIPEGETVMIADFETGEFTTPWGGVFYYYSDAGEGGNSDLSYDIVDGDSSKNLKLTFMLDGGSLGYQYAGLTMDVAADGGTRNLSTCKALRYDYKGAAHNFRVQSGIDVGYQYHQKEIGAAEEWTPVTIILAEDLFQPVWATLTADINDVLKQATAIEWQMTSGATEGTLEIDNVRCSNLPIYNIAFVDGVDTVEVQRAVAGDMPKCAGCADYEKEPTAQYAFSFSGSWSPAIVAAAADTKYQMLWDTTWRSYTVSFINENGDNLQSSSWVYGATPVYSGETPVKVGDAQYSYTFNGWSPEIESVAGEAEYVAQFEEKVNSYWVKFVNDDGTKIDSTVQEYGTSVAELAEKLAPTKTDPEGLLTYTFDGWSPEIDEETIVTGNVVYTATYKVGDKYTVTFMNGSEVLLRLLVDEDETPVYTGTAPTRNADAQFVYSWNEDDGWDKPLGPVAKSVTYMAKFDSTLQVYNITFKDDNGTEIATKEFTYGTYISDEDAPEFSRTEADWNDQFDFPNYSCSWPEMPMVTGAATYTAQCQYRVTFVYNDWDASSEGYAYGATPVPDMERAEKSPDVATVYTFTGWSPAITAVGQHSATYVAQYSSSPRQYYVKFVVGSVTIDSTMYDYNTPAADVVVPPDPTKPSTENFSYEFRGWNKDIMDVKQNMMYSAVFEPVTRKYLVTFDVAGVKTSKEYEYGTAAADIVLPEDLTKPATAQYSYTFKSWDKEVVEVTGEATYTAVFDSALVEYSIIFVVNGKADTAAYEYGTAAADIVLPEDLTKPATVQYTYTFKSWDKEVVEVTGEATYTAVFDSALVMYPIVFVIDGKADSSAAYAYGTKAADIKKPATEKKATAQYTYTFKSWDKEVVDVTAAATYTAKFDSTVNKYMVKFVVDGKADSATYAYGTKAADIKKPATEKKATAQYTYTFKAWDKEVVDVTAAATYTAVFDSTVNKYLIKFVVDGKADSATYAYGTKAADIKKPATEKKATAQYTYTFKSWDKEVVDVTAAATYTAKFDSTVNKYMVKFVVDGKVVDSTMYAYGTAAKDVKEPEAKKADTKDSTFTFDGWDKKIADVTEAATYTAKFTSKTGVAVAKAPNSFKFGFANNELTVVQPSPSMVRVQVFDLTGHLVESFSETVAGSQSFSLAHLNQGSYMVRIVSKSQMRSARVIVK